MGNIVLVEVIDMAKSPRPSGPREIVTVSSKVKEVVRASGPDQDNGPGFSLKQLSLDGVEFDRIGDELFFSDPGGRTGSSAGEGSNALVLASDLDSGVLKAELLQVNAVINPDLSNVGSLVIIGTSNDDQISINEPSSVPPDFGAGLSASVFAGNGDDIVVVSGGFSALIYGGGGNDTLVGGAEADNLVGGDGSDEFVLALGEGVELDRRLRNRGRPNRPHRRAEILRASDQRCLDDQGPRRPDRIRRRSGACRA